VNELTGLERTTVVWGTTHTPSTLAISSIIAVIRTLLNRAIFSKPSISTEALAAWSTQTMTTALRISNTLGLAIHSHRHNLLLSTEFALPAFIAGHTHSVLACAVAMTIVLARHPWLNGVTAIRTIPSIGTLACAASAQTVARAVSRTGHLLTTVCTRVPIFAKANSGSPTKEHTLPTVVAVICTLHIRTVSSLPTLLTRALTNIVVASAMHGTVERAVLGRTVVTKISRSTNASPSMANTVVIAVVVALAWRIVAHLAS